MIKSKHSYYILGFLLINVIFFLIVQWSFGINEFFKIYGLIGFLLPSVFLYCFGLIGFYLFKRKEKSDITVSEEKENLNSIDGWLLFFIISLIIFSPLFNLYRLFSQIETLAFADMVGMLASISLFIISGIFLWRKKPYAVKFAKIILITTFIVNIISAVYYSDYSDTAQGTISDMVWVLYLYNSRRVKQVYGNLHDKQTGMQIWPIMAIIYAFIAPVFGVVFGIVGLINIYKNRKLKGKMLSTIALIISLLLL